MREVSKIFRWKGDDLFVPLHKIEHSTCHKYIKFVKFVVVERGDQDNSCERKGFVRSN